ncbi:hypothetical protein AAC387_Pa02g2533 [Persea americana]
MDVPSTSRIRPTASNRRLCQRFVANVSEGDKEVVEEQPEAEDWRNSLGASTSLSMLPSFRMRIATSIWRQQERPPLKCISHGQKISEWAWNSEGRQNTVFSRLIGRSGLAPLVVTSYRSIDKNMGSAFVERWQPETNTFHMPFGEMTISLDDVSTILGIPVTGKFVLVELLSFERSKTLVEYVPLLHSVGV